MKTFVWIAVALSLGLTLVVIPAIVVATTPTITRCNFDDLVALGL